MANVAIWGQRDRQYQVLVDPDRLRLNGVTLDAVVKSVTDTAAVAGGGFIDMPNQRIAVRHRAAIEEPEDLAKTTVAFRNGAPLRLGDVADVKIGFPPPIGDAVINDGEGLAPDRREAADRQHAGSHQERREGHRRPEARIEGR